ncbi:MAG: abortive infection system antitoxin AbiGi family protein [Bacteroidota bacterium]
MIASSLFHFTKYKGLKAILQSGCLRASYNLEEVSDLKQGFKYCAIPMICFCDIPLKSLPDQHILSYGAYGLGFTKEWAIQNKVQPILYRIDGSDIIKSTSELIESNNRSSELLNKLDPWSDQLNNQSFTKLVESSVELKGLIFDNYAFSKPYGEDGRYYREREWRYKAHSPLTFSNRKSDRSDINKAYHEDLNDTSKYLNFDISDIEHVVLKKRSDMRRFISFINSTYPKMKETERYLLFQKVTDLETIQRDM